MNSHNLCVKVVGHLHERRDGCLLTGEGGEVLRRGDNKDGGNSEGEGGAHGKVIRE
jgi:hypothetical protein